MLHNLLIGGRLTNPIPHEHREHREHRVRLKPIELLSHHYAHVSEFFLCAQSLRHAGTMPDARTEPVYSSGIDAHHVGLVRIQFLRSSSAWRSEGKSSSDSAPASHCLTWYIVLTKKANQQTSKTSARVNCIKYISP